MEEAITKIEVELCGNTYQLISYNVNFSQNFNLGNGKVAGKALGNLLELSVVGDGGTELFEWMIEQTQEEDGTITFYSDQTDVKTIEFRGALLVGYNQNLDQVTDFQGNNERVISEDLSIIYQELDIDGVTYVRNEEG